MDAPTPQPQAFPVEVPDRTTGYRYDALISRWHDGDTVYLDIDLGFGVWVHDRPIRMLGINAPELNTPEGKAALAFIAPKYPEGTPVVLLSKKDSPDKFGGRYLGTIFDGKQNLNQLMIDSGHAKPWDGTGTKPV